MHGLTTIHKLNAQNREAEEILAKYAREDAIRQWLEENKPADSQPAADSQPVAA